MHSSKMLFATLGSTALKGSSNKMILALEYTARARLIRAFCPPEMFIPLSPMSVSAPFPRIFKSLVSCAN